MTIILHLKHEVAGRSKSNGRRGHVRNCPLWKSLSEIIDKSHWLSQCSISSKSLQPYNWDQSNPKRLERIDYRPIEEFSSGTAATHPKSMLFWTYFDSIKASSPWKWWWFAACDSLRDLNNRTNNHELRFCGLRNRMNHWSSQSSELSTVHYQKRTKQSPSSKWFCVRMSPTSQKLFPDRSHNWTQTVWWWQCAFSRPPKRLRRS